MTAKELRDRIISLLSGLQGDAIPQSFLHRSLSASKSRVSEVLSELEKEGLIKRKQVGRSKIIYVQEGISERRSEEREKKITIGIVYSSEYLFLFHFLERLKEEGIEAEVKVFSEGIEAIDALGHGKIEISISPLVGQVIMYPIYESYSIVAKGMGRGYRILWKEGGEKVFSSKLSTMDYIRSIALKRKIIEGGKTLYYRSSEELIKEARKEKGYVVTWHPIYKKLEEIGFKEVETEGLIENELCCSLGISNVLKKETREKIFTSYMKSLEDYEKSKEKYLDAYSLITGIDVVFLKDAVKEYKLFEGESRSVLSELLNNLSPAVPHVSIFQKAIMSI